MIDYTSMLALANEGVLYYISILLTYILLEPKELSLAFIDLTPWTYLVYVDIVAGREIFL